jgi:uncharacterized protein YndB with AHSA1/START domain
MYTNTLEVIINAPVKNVWSALTEKDKIKEWMNNTVVETDWKVGSSILYTCYDTKGNIMTWNGKQMIWEGVVEKVIPQKEITCFYPSLAEGLEKESFQLLEVFPEVTKVTLSQDFLAKETAHMFLDNAKDMLLRLKQFLELWY